MHKSLRLTSPLRSYSTSVPKKLIPASLLRSLPNQPPKQIRSFSASTSIMDRHGDLNNSHAARVRVDIAPDLAYSGRSLAISIQDDEPDVRERYRPFLLDEAHKKDDWVSQLELSTALKMVESEIISQGQPRLRILVLYGSLRNRFVRPPFLPLYETMLRRTSSLLTHFAAPTLAYSLMSAHGSCSVSAAMSACTTPRACRRRMMSSTPTPKCRSFESLASGVTATSGSARSSTAT